MGAPASRAGVVSAIDLTASGVGSVDNRTDKDALGDKLRQTLVLRPAENRASFDAVGTARSDEFAPIRIGGKIDGYKIESPLAEGGMGAIYRVKDRAGERDLALKAPLP